MDAALRKRHKYIWLSLAVILPILLILVIKDLDFSPVEGPSYVSEATINPVKEAKHDLMDAMVIKRADTYVLELNVKQPLKSASSVVYLWDENNGAGLEIGQIAGVGRYTFQLKNETDGIIIIDVIKNQEILKLEF